MQTRIIDGVIPSARQSGILLVLMMIGSLGGCHDYAAHPHDAENDMVFEELELIPCSQTVNQLKDYYARKSIGGELLVQDKEGLLFIQAFPYSGVCASHLYVYARRADVFGFLCFFHVPTQDAIETKLSDDGSVAVWTGSVRVAVIDAVAAR